jgi:hypothetical protein
MHKIDTKLTRDIFALYADMENSDADKYLPLIDSAAIEIEGMLADDIDVYANAELLSSVAAGIAYADYCASGVNGGFSVGEISVSSSGSVSPSELRKAFLEKGAHLFKNKKMAFVAV